MATEEKMSVEQILKALHEKEVAEKGKCQEDVGFVSNSIEKGTFSPRDFLGGDLLRFAENIDPESKKMPSLGKNVDFAEKDEAVSFLELNEIMSLESAPLGKWPAKGQIKFWEQCDVNLSVRKGSGEAFVETGKILAAKEKTEEEKMAVLRELLASNIVEKASVLASYDKPDDAFQSFDFYHGEQKNHAYAEYPAKWHRIRDDALGEYYTWMCSYDPKALEKICKSLNQDKTLGQVAVSLSNEVERKEFYEKVILPYVKALRDADLAKDRMPAYTKARDAFLAQKKVVLDLQASLGRLQLQLLRNWKEERMQMKSLRGVEAEIEHSKKDSETAEETRKPLQDKRNEVTKELNEVLEKMEEIGAKAQEARDEWTRYNEVIRTGFDKELELRNSVNGVMKLLNKKKYDAVMEQADQCQKEAIEAQEKAPAAEKKMKELSGQYSDLSARRAQLQTAQDSILDKLSQINKTINNASTLIARKKEELDLINHSLEAIRKERKEIVDDWSKETGDDKRIIMDPEFLKDLLSKDEKVAGKRAAENPWFSQKYQKEREKLFTMALELTKAFMEASECVAANLATLSQYFGFWKKGNDKIVFHDADKEDTVPFLWQTLAMFMPMIAVEGSSVSSLFTDAKKAGLLGLLVVDGAEKTKPQELIGELYRSRRAVIFSTDTK